MDTKEQIRVLREYQYGRGDGQTHFGPHSFDLTNETVDAIIKALEAYETCRNELCLYCGQYKQRHLGACDGCRWKEYQIKI